MESVSKHDSGYEVALSKNIPPKQIFVIEYPGYIKNTDKVLHTLGGEKGLKKVKINILKNKKIMIIMQLVNNNLLIGYFG